MSLTAPRRLGRYQLRYRIAMGGMGGVYLARAVGAGGADKVVAVKLLHDHLAEDDTAVKMFLDEARIASALNHVNVCTTFDFGEEEGVYFLVMEYLEGEPLDRVTRSLEKGAGRHPRHPWLVAHLLIEAAEGLHAAHRLLGADGRPMHVVHRDVSPHNVFVTYDGVTKVVDFGIARARERLSSKTEAGAFKGKFDYAAPEQLSGEAVDARTDVWALGVCLWELLVGERLFKRAELSLTLRAVLHEPIPAPSTRGDVPPEFDEVVLRALSRDPADRFESARDFGRALRALIQSAHVTIDAVTVQEWLEALFPGDRERRSGLVAAVRQAGPDAPLELVPAQFKVTESRAILTPEFKRSLQDLPAVPAKPRRSKKAPPPPARESSSRAPLIVAALAVLVAAAAVAVWVLPAHPSGRLNNLPSDDVDARANPREGEGRQPDEVLVAAGDAGEAAADIVDAAEALAAAQAVDAGGVLASEDAVDAAEALAAAHAVDAGGVAAEDAVDAGEALAAAQADAGGVLAAEDAVDARGVLASAEPVDAGAELRGVDAGVRSQRPPRPPPGVVKRPPLPVPPIVEAQTPPPRGLESAGRGLGRVRFSTPGVKADVFIDGVRRGSTPLVVDLPQGSHTFDFRAPNTQFTGTQRLEITTGGEYDVTVEAER